MCNLTLLILLDPILHQFYNELVKIEQSVEKFSANLHTMQKLISISYGQSNTPEEKQKEENHVHSLFSFKRTKSLPKIASPHISSHSSSASPVPSLSHAAANNFSVSFSELPVLKKERPKSKSFGNSSGPNSVITSASTSAIPTTSEPDSVPNGSKSKLWSKMTEKIFSKQTKKKEKDMDESEDRSDDNDDENQSAN